MIHSMASRPRTRAGSLHLLGLNRKNHGSQDAHLAGSDGQVQHGYVTPSQPFSLAPEEHWWVAQSRGHLHRRATSALWDEPKKPDIYSTDLERSLGAASPSPRPRLPPPPNPDQPSYHNHRETPSLPPLPHLPQHSIQLMYMTAMLCITSAAPLMRAAYLQSPRFPDHPGSPCMGIGTEMSALPPPSLVFFLLLVDTALARRAASTS